MRHITAVCIGILLLATFHLYRYSYFSTDDFIGLYWVQLQSGTQMFWHLVNPVSSFFRPAGLAVYWILLRFFDLEPMAYHGFAWFLHSVNTALVYFVLKRLTSSRSGAAVGAMSFASQAAFADIYWSFGTIYELLSACAFFVGVLVWMKHERTWIRVIACLFIFMFAVKAKEMAITLPAIWLLSDLLLRVPITIKKCAHIVLPAVLGAGYGLLKLRELRQIEPDDLYYMDFRWIALGRSLAHYFNSIFNTTFRWQLWAIGFVGLLLIFLAMRNRTGAFLQIYILLTFLPVIFMINHRELYLAYIPFFGICGLAALLTKTISEWFLSRVSERTAMAAACVLFPLLCWGDYSAQKVLSEGRRKWQQPMSSDYRSFVSELRTLPPFPPNETIFFDSHPLFFNADLLFNATQVALRRTDIHTQLVSEFPENARYRLHYENSRLTVVAP